MAPSSERIHFLMYDATGTGGVARSVNLLAGHLAQHREVHLHSLLRNHDDPPYPIDPRVQVHWLLDNRRRHLRRGRPRHDRLARPRWRRLDSEPSALEPDAGISAYTDLLLRRALPTLAPGVLVTTRPMLHLAAVRWAPPHVVHVAQDHLNYERRMSNPVVRSILDEAVPNVDALVTLTEADRRDYRLRYPRTPVFRIPNASPFTVAAGGSLADQVVVSGGRLVDRKGFDRLIAAWAVAVAEFPDWQLHIYGEGECRDDLERQVAALGVGNSVRLPGYTHDFDQVLAQAGLYAMASRQEGFPMVLLEAMRHGLPMLSFDCPRGPAEIIEDGVTGRLVANGDVAAYAEALCDLLADEELRRRLGEAAHGRASSYQIEAVGSDWETLFDQVLELGHARPGVEATVGADRR